MHKVDESKLEPPFEVPEGFVILQQGYKGDGEGVFREYFMIYAHKKVCVFAENKDSIDFDAVLVCGQDNTNKRETRIRYTAYKKGGGKADLLSGYLQFSKSEWP